VESQPLLIYSDCRTGRSSEILVCFRQRQSNGSHHNYNCQALSLKNKFSDCPTRCDLFSLLYFCRQLYMFRV